MENNNEVNNLEKRNLKKEQTNINKNNKNNKKKLWIIIGIIIVIAIASIIVYATFSEDICLNSINLIPFRDGSSSNSSNNIDKPATPSDLHPSYDKPIIYLYPEKEIQLSVRLGKENNITCSYPEYKNGWNVLAKPDGTLVDIETGRGLYALYWEGIRSEKCNLKEGFVVKGNQTIQFLEEKLAVLGLNERESEEFIVYWLPKLQKNEYNYIRFATLEEINNNMPLELSIEPDTLIRVLMQYKPLDKYMEVKEQKLVTPDRNGFTVVEWGGTEIE